MVEVVGFGDPTAELPALDAGSAIQGWDSGWGSYMFIADRSARMTTNITGQNVQIYTGWPETAGAALDTSSLATNSGTERSTLTNFSWTINANTTDNRRSSNTAGGDRRNNSLHHAGIEWNNGDILVRGAGAGHRFGLGSGNVNNQGTVIGTFNNIRIQAQDARFIFQLRAFVGATVTNVSIDDFTYSNARTDANFPGGQIYTNFATGAAQNIDAGVPDTENGNFSGVAADEDTNGNIISDAFAPTTLITPNIRRLKVPTPDPAEVNRPDFSFRHSVKGTPMIMVDPIFTFINSIDIADEVTQPIISTTTALNEYYSLYSSSDTNDAGKNQAQPNTFVWFGFRISLQPQTAGGRPLSGEYWVVGNNGEFSDRDYLIDGITNDSDYILTGRPPVAPQGVGGSGIAGSGFEVDAAGNDTVQVFSVTEHWDNGTTIVTTGDQLLFEDLTDIRRYIFIAFGYRPLSDPINPRTRHGVIEDVVEPVAWLKNDTNSDPTTLSLNDVGRSLYDYLIFDSRRNHPESQLSNIDWTDEAIDFNYPNGLIRQNDNIPSFTGPVIGERTTWDIGRNHIPDTTANAAAHHINEPIALSEITTINATNTEFDAERQEIRIPILNVMTIKDLRTGLILDAKTGGKLTGSLVDFTNGGGLETATNGNVNIRLNNVDVSDLIVPAVSPLQPTSFTIYGTDENGDDFTDQSFNVQIGGTTPGGIGAGNFARGLPRVETVTLPSHGVQLGWYYTTRTPVGTTTELTIEADSDPIRIESDEDVVFNLSSAGGTGSYRGTTWVAGDILTVYYKYDSLIKTQPDDPDNIAYQETAVQHTFGEAATRDLAPPPLIPSTQTEQAEAPENYSTDTHRFTDYTFAFSADQLDNPVGALAIRTYSGQGGSLATKSPESLALALLIGNDPNFMRKFVEVSRADPDNVIVPIFTVLGGNQVRWNPDAITLASDEILDSTDPVAQYRVQQTVAFWEYADTFDPIDFSLARTGAAEVISFTPGEASLQQVQSAAQNGIDSSNTGMLIEESHNINHFLLAGDGGRFLGIKPRIESFDPATPYDNQ